MNVSDFKKMSKRELADFLFKESPAYERADDEYKQYSFRAQTKLYFKWLACDCAEDADDYDFDQYKLTCIKKKLSKPIKATVL